MKQQVFLVLGLAVAVAACSSSSNNTPDASGAAGTTGAAGTSAAGTTGAAGTGEAGTTGAAGTGEAGTTGAAGTGAAGTGAAGTACTAIGHTGPQAPEVAGVGTFPTPAGGTVVPGTYDLKEFRIFPPGSVDAYIRQETLKLTATTIEQAGKSYDNKESMASGTYSTSGAEVTINATCPGTMTIKLPYTATATELWLFDSGTDKEVHVYTKRQ